MSTSTEASVNRAQALAWRMDRQLLDPVGSLPAAAVVRRLGAVLSMNESLAELAVATRRTTSRPGRLAKALAEGDGRAGARRYQGTAPTGISSRSSTKALTLPSNRCRGRAA